MRLHWNRVRRARGLSMPLPPTPRRRPLSPPVLFSIDGYDIRTQRDVDLWFESWDDFLDRVAEAGLCQLQGGLTNDALLCFHSVARIVPEDERRDLVRELMRRMSGLCDGGLIQSLSRSAA